MPDTIKSILTTQGVLNHVILPTEIDVMLGLLAVVGAQKDLGGGISTGDVQLTNDLNKSPIAGFDFSLTLPTDLIKSAPYKLKLDPVVGPTSFQFWLQLADQGQVLPIFKFVKEMPGLVLTGATKTTNPDGTISLVGDPKNVPHLVSRSPEPGAALGPALLISGSATSPASTRFTPDTDSTKGIVSLGLDPPTVVFGDSGIGFECPTIVIDDSEEDKAPGEGAPALDPPLPSIAADAPSWRGLLARDFDFYLPASVPLFGGRPIKAFFAIGRGNGGVAMAVESTVPSQAGPPSRNGYSIRIECMDSTAIGLSGLVPTLISATMELPLDGNKQGFNSNDGTPRDITFAAGKPVRVTATLARDPVNSPGEFKISIGVAAQGQDGLLSVTSTAMGGAKIFNTAATLATALIADKNIENKADKGNTPGVVLAVLVAAGAALSSLFTDDSRFVLHGAEIESSGHGLPISGAVVLTLDYSVAVRITEISIPGALAVSMSPDQPMRIRVRKARMSLDPAKSGLSMIGLDFGRSAMEIEDPGAWNVQGLESLFDVLRSRSGRGSSWIEVDLRFKVNLGPIHVSGATIRGTLNGHGSIDASIRGLEAGLSIPGAIKATGGLQLIDKGFSASLSACVMPLNLSVDAGIIYAPPMIVLRLDVDLPAPIPLANTGFGLLGIGGLLGFSALPDYGADADPDPILRQLKWTPVAATSFKATTGEDTFGFSAAVGTLPDLGFTLSAKAGVLISVPDIAVRGSLNGKVMQPAVKMSDPSFPPSPGISFLGFVAVDAASLSFGLFGEVNLKPLLEVHISLAGFFPLKTSAAGDPSDWYVYLGADGAQTQGRQIGPISARVLPDVINSGADAYLMLRGKGMKAWPNRQPMLDIADGFVIAFGFGLQYTFGVRPIVWAEVYASLDLLIGAKPQTLAGFGRAGGSLNLGPFSLGVEAQVSFMLSSGQQYFWAELTGKIEMLFFDIEGTVTISFGQEPDLTLPKPDLHPLDRLDANGLVAGSLGALTDDSYRVIAPLVEDPTLITDGMQVWPDAMVSLPFAINPSIKDPDAGTQFPAIVGPGASPPCSKMGSEMLFYTWRLDRVELVDVTQEADKFAGAGILPVGQLASRWQAPRGSGGSTDLYELLLFSTSGDLWVNRLADSGAGQPTNPLERNANLCQRTVGAQPGWAIGYLAVQDQGGFRLPPDSVSSNPLVSRVEAHMGHFGLTLRGQAIPLGQTYTLPEPFTVNPAKLSTWPREMDVKHPFDGHLVAPSLRWLTGRDLEELLGGGYAFGGQQVQLTLTEAIINGLLVLVADPDLYKIAENFVGLRVFDDTGAMWRQADLVTIPTSEIAAIFIPPDDHPVQQLQISFPIGRALAIVGVGGTTLTARDLAAAENKTIADEAARQATAASTPPSSDRSVNQPHQRAILDPGRTYRLDIDMLWSGEIDKQDDSGKQVPVETVIFGDTGTDTYSPKGGVPSTSTKRHFFFKTAPKPAGRAVVKHGAAQYVHWLTQQQNVFQPEMLQRYLAGYDPGQSEEFRFFTDPLRAHFLQDHVAALATAYGFDMLVAVRRVDAPGDDFASPILLTPDWTAVTDKSFLSKTDQVRYDLAAASACTVPKPGATATVNAALDPEAWYEIYVLAKSLDGGFTDGRLPGVTFKTSRWPEPTEMLLDLGFSIGLPVPPAAPTGDLLIDPPAALDPAVVEGQDQAFQNTLHQLGLDGWPIAEEPRLSRMWLAGPEDSWLFAGLMIESPEPIHRPGRLEVDGLSLQMGRAGASIRFDVRRRDRSGSRLLYLTSTPFPVITRERTFKGLPGKPIFHSVTPTLVITARSILSTVTPISGTLVIPSAPTFAEDP